MSSGLLQLMKRSIRIRSITSYIVFFGVVSIIFPIRETRVERATFWPRTRRSTKLSYSLYSSNYRFHLQVSGLFRGWVGRCVHCRHKHNTFVDFHTQSVRFSEGPDFDCCGCGRTQRVAGPSFGTERDTIPEPLVGTVPFGIGMLGLRVCILFSEPSEGHEGQV